MKFRNLGFVPLLMLCAACPAGAVTVAQWRWETGPAGTNVAHTTPDGQFQGAVPDVSGNGNSLSAWSQGGCCGYQYRADVPFTTIPQTGAVNAFSVKNTGGGPGMFTDSAVSAPTGVNLETMTPTAFTVEASWKPENGGYRTVVGRDARNVATGDGALAALYFQAQPNNSFAIKFTDLAGNFHVAESPAGLIQGFDFGSDPDGVNGKWYNLVGVSDGSTLKLYVNNALVASTPIVSTNPGLAVGTTSGGDWHAGEWSVGRGLFNGGHTDRAYGYIDEVRISDTALSPLQFLVPTALSLTVNTTTGQISLKNDASYPVTVDYYKIASPMGALKVADWNSLDKQNFSALDGPDAGSIAGDSPGEGWDQAGGSNANQLIEQFVRKEGSTIAGNQTLILGNAFDTSKFGVGNPGDLTFEFSFNGGAAASISTVAYVTGLSGNYDGDTDVDGNDFLRWQRGLSPNPLSAGDLAAWKSGYGAGGGVVGAAAAIPEPSGAVLAALAVAVLGAARKRS
jgi:hypothetical protein